MSETLVKVENVSKKFCRDLKRSLWYGMKDIGSELVGRNNHQDNLRHKEFWALQDISFKLKRGEVLGLIGRNGAGKTTLLKILNGLIKPDNGKVTMRGKVGALISLGAGFNPILTGRENIYVNGAVLGLSKKEIDEKFDEIVDFAELWDFIETPVQSYSSGMQVRLGFAVATALNPDILLLDEVLAVGDAAFRAKCYNRISCLVKNTAVIFVSHQMEHIARICNKTLLFQQGELIHFGIPVEGISIYNKNNESRLLSNNSNVTLHFPVSDGSVTFDNLTLEYGQNLSATIKIELLESMKHITLRLVIHDLLGRQVGEWGNIMNNLNLNLNRGISIVKFNIPIQLRPGEYNLSICLSDEQGVSMNYWSHNIDRLVVNGNAYGYGEYQIFSSNCTVTSI